MSIPGISDEELRALQGLPAKRSEDSTGRVMYSPKEMGGDSKDEVYGNKRKRTSNNTMRINAEETSLNEYEDDNVFLDEDFEERIEISVRQGSTLVKYEVSNAVLPKSAWDINDVKETAWASSKYMCSSCKLPHYMNCGCCDDLPPRKRYRMTPFPPIPDQ